MSRLKTIDCIPVIFQRIAFNHIDKILINLDIMELLEATQPQFPLWMYSDLRFVSVDVFLHSMSISPPLIVPTLPHFLDMVCFFSFYFFLKAKDYVCQSIVYEYATYLFIILNWQQSLIDFFSTCTVSRSLKIGKLPTFLVKLGK